MIKDVSGFQFGLLTAVVPTGEKRFGVAVWQCVCMCGRSHSAAVNSLTQGLVRSCGCLRSISAQKRSGSHGLRGTPAYKSWDAMTQRCLNRNNPNYKKYGALGVQVCDRWRDFQDFFADMGPREAGMTLDRINPSGDYCPENCRWADVLTQSRNKRKPTTSYAQAELIRQLYSDGFFPKEIVELTGISRGSVNGVIYLGQVTQLD